MSAKPTKRYRRGLDPDEQIAAALRKGLSQDKSDVDNNPVFRKLNKTSSQPQYNVI